MESDKGRRASASRRGYVSAGRWADLRQAARLACSENVSLTMHGITITPFVTGSKENRPPRYDVTKVKPVPDARSKQRPLEASGAPCASTSKRQQRSAQRLQDYQEKQRARVQRWLTMTQNLHRCSRAKLRADVWTAWMRERTQQVDSAPPTNPALGAEPTSAELIARDRDYALALEYEDSELGEPQYDSYDPDSDNDSAKRAIVVSRTATSKKKKKKSG